jgi:hypothetical protein
MNIGISSVRKSMPNLPNEQGNLFEIPESVSWLTLLDVRIPDTDLALGETHTGTFSLS